MIESFFNFKGHQFFIDFNNDNVNELYIVYDKISKVPVSRIIEAKNDLVAIRGFEQLIESQKKENQYSILQLINLGDINYDLKMITESSGDDKFVCDSDFDFKTFYEESFNWLKAQEDNE